MDTIVLADHIGKWLAHTSKNSDLWMFKIISATEFEEHYIVDYAIKPQKVNFGRIYNNESRYYKLISDEEAQAILNSRVRPHPNQKVIDKIKEMQDRRRKLGYKYV